MNRLPRVFLTALWLIAAALPWAAAERVLTPADRRTEATTIVDAAVVAVTGRDVPTRRYGEGTIETHYTVTLKVERLDKGAGSRRGTLIEARCWRMKSYGSEGFQPGPGGHFHIPRSGERVRAFLTAGSRPAEGPPVFDVVYPSGLAPLPTRGELRPLREALTFFAGFDDTADASFALGDPRFHSITPEPPGGAATPGLPADRTITLGQHRDAPGRVLRFNRRDRAAGFFDAEHNVAFRSNDWEGTVRFTLGLDASDSGSSRVCRPFVLGTAGELASSLVTQFEQQEHPESFRVGFYPAQSRVEREARPWRRLPLSEQPVVGVVNPPLNPWAATEVMVRWSHVGGNRFPNEPHLTIELVQQGNLTRLDVPQFSFWGGFDFDPKTTRLQLGEGLAGWLDDLTIFNRRLTDDEVEALRRLPEGPGDLLREFPPGAPVTGE